MIRVVVHAHKELQMHIKFVATWYLPKAWKCSQSQLGCVFPRMTDLWGTLCQCQGPGDEDHFMIIWRNFIGIFEDWLMTRQKHNFCSFTDSTTCTHQIMRWSQCCGPNWYSSNLLTRSWRMPIWCKFTKKVVLDRHLDWGGVSRQWDVLVMPLGTAKRPLSMIPRLENLILIHLVSSVILHRLDIENQYN